MRFSYSDQQLTLDRARRPWRTQEVKSGSNAVRLDFDRRLAGYEDVNDAERLRHDPAMRWIVGGKAAQSSAAWPSQMGRFETQWLAAPKNFAALADLSGQLSPPVPS